MFGYLEAHDFFMHEAPEQSDYATPEEEAAALAYDEEGYVSDEEVEHLRKSMQNLRLNISKHAAKKLESQVLWYEEQFMFSFAQTLLTEF